MVAIYTNEWMMTTLPTNQPYLLIALESGPEALEAAAVALFDCGAEGLVEEKTSIGARLKAYFAAPDWPEIRPVLEDRLKRVNRYFPAIELIEEFQAVRSVFAPPLAIAGQKTLGEWAGLVLDRGREG